LSGGTVYGAPSDGVGSIRRILPSSSPTFSARRSGSPPEPPSPMPMYSMLSGPIMTLPPLWLGYGWSIVSRSVRLAGSKTPSGPTRYDATTVSSCSFVWSMYAVAPSGEKARPSRPRSPSPCVDPVMSSTAPPARPSRTGTIRPARSTTNMVGSPARHATSTGWSSSATGANETAGVPAAGGPGGAEDGAAAPVPAVPDGLVEALDVGLAPGTVAKVTDGAGRPSSPPPLHAAQTEAAHTTAPSARRAFTDDRRVPAPPARP
jgi:hypothetical protein